MIIENAIGAQLAVLAGLHGTSVLGYIGPGVGLTVIGAALALLAGIFLLIVGFIWYPVKRLLQRFAKPESEGTKEAVLACDTGNSSEPSE